MIQSNDTRYVRLCVHYLGNHELSGPPVFGGPSIRVPFVVS